LDSGDTKLKLDSGALTMKGRAPATKEEISTVSPELKTGHGSGEEEK